ncbi:MAG: hypothetical protein U1F54_18810 [Burkholderiales bacterium]
MKRRVTVVSAGDAAYLLRRRLGPVREFSDFLADARRDGTTSYYGHTLLPCAYVFDGRTKRPVYSVQDIAAFVHAVSSKIGVGGDPQKVRGRSVLIEEGVHWRTQEVRAA